MGERVSTRNGSAIAPNDYTETKGRVAIPTGTLEPYVDVRVPLVNDSSSEGTQTFYPDLKDPSHGKLGDSTATGTISD